jgi:predicted ATPase
MIAGMAGRIVSPVIVGRRAELDRAMGALEAAETGSPVHLLVAGEAGVGKSRLVAELAARAESRSVHVLRGGCASMGTEGLPYGPIVEILGDMMRALDERRSARSWGRRAPTWRGSSRPSTRPRRHCRCSANGCRPAC